MRALEKVLTPNYVLKFFHFFKFIICLLLIDSSNIVLWFLFYSPMILIFNKLLKYRTVWDQKSYFFFRISAKVGGGLPQWGTFSFENNFERLVRQQKSRFQTNRLTNLLLWIFSNDFLLQRSFHTHLFKKIIWLTLF